jgi:hypothetical protein
MRKLELLQIGHVLHLFVLQLRAEKHWKGPLWTTTALLGMATDFLPAQGAVVRHP